MALKRILNKWQPILCFGANERTFGGHQFSIGLIKFISFPQFLCENFKKKHYIGFAVTIGWYIPYWEDLKNLLLKHSWKHQVCQREFSLGNYIKIW